MFLQIIQELLVRVYPVWNIGDCPESRAIHGMTQPLLVHLLKRRTLIPSTLPLIHYETIWDNGEDHTNLELKKYDYLEGYLVNLDHTTGQEIVAGAHAVSFFAAAQDGNLLGIDSGNEVYRLNLISKLFIKLIQNP